jgi:cellulose biosynthesis protein BcsQ
MSIDSPTQVVVLGHRGGSGKTAFASLLAGALARSQEGVVLLDASASGAAAHLSDGLRRPSPAPWRQGQSPVTFGALPLQVAWAPGCLSGADKCRAVVHGMAGAGASVLVVDTPVCSPPEVATAVQRADVVLVVVPAHGVALRTLGPLLEAVRAERAKPGRHFETRIVLSLTGDGSPESAQVEAAAREWLGAALLPESFALDPAVRRSMARGESPAILDPPACVLSAAQVVEASAGALPA